MKMDEEQLLQELIDFCNRHIKEAGTEKGYYHEMKKVLQGKMESK